MSEITPEQFVSWGRILGRLTAIVELGVSQAEKRSNDVSLLRESQSQVIAKIDGIQLAANNMQQSVESNTKEIGEFRTELAALKKAIDMQTAVEADTVGNRLSKNPIFITVLGLIICFGIGAAIYAAFGKENADSASQLTKDLIPQSELIGPPEPTKSE